MNSKLKAAREASGMTQTEIAAKTEIAPMSYQRYEAGKRVPNAATAKLIAHALNSTVEDLF